MFSDKLNRLARSPLGATLLVSLLLAFGAAAADQDVTPEQVGVAAFAPPQEMPKPGAEHAWIAKRAGSWDIKSKMRFTPDSPWMNSTATEEDKVICGGFWMNCSFSGTFMGIPFSGQQQLGYDQHKKQFVSTWIDSFGSWLSVSHGTLSKDQKVLTLSGPMYDPQQDKNINTKMVVTIKSDDEVMMQMYMPGEGDEMWVNMQLDYKRKKTK